MENQIKIRTKFNKKVFLVILLFIFCIGFNLVKATDDVGENEINKETVIALVNLERTGRGVNQLKENEILDKVAQSKLNNMIENDYFAHTSPKGVNSWEWFAREGYQFEYAGENLAMNFSNSKEQHEAWMESPTHRKNILDERFTDVGVAVKEKYIDGEKFFLTVQVFGTPEKNTLKSASFTPQTFQVSSEIVYADLDSDGLSLNNNFDGFGSSEYSKYKVLVWSFLIIITLMVVFIEYRFFSRQNR